MSPRRSPLDDRTRTEARRLPEEPDLLAAVGYPADVASETGPL